MNEDSSLKDIDLEELLDTDDVGQKRYIMNQVLELVLEEVYEDVPQVEDRVSELETNSGYVYKLVQDFLTSSSTMRKEKKLRKMVDYLD